MITANQLRNIDKRCKLLSIGTNAKTVKGDKLGEYVTAILYMAPADNVEGLNLCPMADVAGCKRACLYTAGRAGIMPNINLARMRKAEWYRDDREGFLLQLDNDIRIFHEWCDKHGVKPAVRLNGTTDVRWEAEMLPCGRSIVEAHQGVQFYDYTKIAKRIGKVPANYHLTFSFSAATGRYLQEVEKAKAAGANLSVVFRGKVLPSEYLGLPVVDGDSDDLRFLDSDAQVVVGLTAKGAAKKDETGFVQDLIATDAA